MRLTARPAKIVKRTTPAGPPLSTRRKLGIMAAVIAANAVLVFLVIWLLVKFWLH